MNDTTFNADTMIPDTVVHTIPIPDTDTVICKQIHKIKKNNSLQNNATLRLTGTHAVMCAPQGFFGFDGSVNTCNIKPNKVTNGHTAPNTQK